MTEDLDQLRASIIAAGAPDPGSPSHPSLDLVEDHCRRIWAEGLPADALQHQVGTWLGAVWVAEAGGRWSVSRGRRFVRDLAELPRARFDPDESVATFFRTRATGYLRDTSEAHDVPLRRRQLAHDLQYLDRELAGLVDDVSELTHRPVDPKDRAAFLSACEDALIALITEEAPREVRRQVRNRVALALGSVLAAETGAEWSVRVDARDADLGQYTIRGWSPIRVVRAVGPRNRRGLLQASLDIALQAARS